MSKGFGRVQREIDAIFRENPEYSFTVEELCQRIYHDWLRGFDDCHGIKQERGIGKRHRVAVLRAAKAVAKRHPDMIAWRAEIRGGTLVFFNHRSVMAYATARLKGDGWGQGGLSDIEARNKLRKDEHHAKMIAPGGHWWRHVQEWIAERDNNAELKEKLKPFQEAAERESAARFAELESLLGQVRH